MRVEGPCETLTVSADAAVVVADQVGTLVVTGAGTAVSVLEVGAVRVSGSANSIAWQTGTPTVADTGTANRLGKASS